MVAAFRALKGEDMTETAEEATDVAEEVTESSVSLADMFNDDEPAPEVTAEPEPKAEDESEKGETEDAEATAEPEAEAKPEATAESEAEPPSAETAGLQAALAAERKLRQEAQAKLKEAEEPVKVPDPIEDPEGYAKHIESKAGDGLMDAKIAISRDLMIDADPEYLNREKIFMADMLGSVYNDDGTVASVTNQALLQQFQQAKNPAKFVNDQVITYLDIKEKSAPDYVDKLTAKIKEEILADIKKPETKLSATELPNLTAASAGNNTVQPARPVTTENMFNDEA